MLPHVSVPMEKGSKPVQGEGGPQVTRFIAAKGHLC